MSEKPANICVKAKVIGRVQGVWFRAWTSREADKLGLTGWVRNEPDGSVAALICGPQDKVDALCRLLWQGPDTAEVSRVEIDPASPPGAIMGFDIRRS